MAPAASGFVAKASLIVVVCLLDLVLNALADDRPVASSRSQRLPQVWVGVQLGLQLMNAILLFMLFFGTYLFQVGLIGVLLREFRGVLAAMAAYAVLFSAYAAVKLANVDALGQDGLWSLPGFVFISIVQKIGSLGYYTVLFQACSKLGEPVWWTRTEWVARYSTQRQQSEGSSGV